MDRDEAYSALSELIFKGFLVAEVDINGKPLIFKTINNRELDLIRVSAGRPGPRSYSVRFHLYYLVYSLLMVDGKNVLLDRNKDAASLYKKIADMPLLLYKNLLKPMNELRAYALMSSKYLEGFCYTSKSRRLWKALSGFPPNDERVTGIPGTSGLGLNVFQESWMLINRSLDAEEEYNKDFSLALLIASSSNPKGSKKVRSQHDSQFHNVQQRREKLAEQGCIDTSQWKPEGWSAPVDTVEELVAELERQMTGMKDKHDMFIENYMDRMRKETERKAQEAEARIKRSREGMDDIYLTSEQRELTSEEMMDLSQKRKRRTVQVSNDSSVDNSDKDRFISKVSGRMLTARS